MPTDTWTSQWSETSVNKEPPKPEAEDENIIREAKERFKICVDWEATARINFEYDYKFANADSQNKYQWDQDVINMREGKPCLTINKVNQHNLMVINDAKQNKPGVRIRPVGDDASYDAAQLFQALVYHTEYISNAESVYDSALTFQVEAGIGYWRLQTDYIDDTSFDQEVYIRRIKDPRSVYLDPNINEVDGSDAWFGFIFDDDPKDLFRAKYSDFAALATGKSVLGEASADGWITQDTVRVCEYYRKTQKKGKLVTWTDSDGAVVLSKIEDLDEQQKEIYKEVKRTPEARKAYQFNERKILIDDVQWFKIAGDRIIDRGPWIGNCVPIIRLVGTETVIDGVLDRKGHTRALIDPQRMYNWNASADVEFGALQSKIPYIAPSAAIEGFEEVWATANSANLSYLPVNHIDDDGNPIPFPQRQVAPQPSPAYMQRMQISINEMMMASGQFQSQFGENENAKSGVAINARQRQGDRATYHFLDNQAMAIRNTGKQLIYIYPKLYDTKRVMRITAQDGTIINMTIDPEAPQAVQEVQTQEQDKEEKIKELIFNPNIGNYDIQADTGPSYATRRMEAFNALTQIAAAQGEKFMTIAGDLYFKVADFPEADVLAQRYRRAIPPAILGDTPDPQTEQAMHQAADKIEQLQALIQQQSKEIADKAREFELKEKDLELRYKEAQVREVREDYKTLSDHIKNLGNAGPGISVEQIQPLVEQAKSELLGMANLDDNIIGDAPGIGQGGTPVEAPEAQGEGDGEPPVPGAKRAPDGNYYVKHGEQHYRVE